MRSPTSLILLALAATVLPAQVTSVVGPPVAPVGCDISISISNDTSAVYYTGVCPFVVRDAAGNVIYAPFCIAIVVDVQPGQTFTTYWNQRDDNNQQVAPGLYFVDVSVAGSVQTHPVVIGGADAAISMLGAPRIGTNRNLRLCSPLDAGYTYVAAASLSTVGIPTCGGVIPLDADQLFFVSLDPANPFFLNFMGTLGAGGVSEAPSVNIPNLPFIVGASFVVDFVVLDFSAACIVRRISLPLTITIV